MLTRMKKLEKKTKSNSILILLTNQQSFRSHANIAMKCFLKTLCQIMSNYVRFISDSCQKLTIATIAKFVYTKVHSKLKNGLEKQP